MMKTRLGWPPLWPSRFFQAFCLWAVLFLSGCSLEPQKPETPVSPPEVHVAVIEKALSLEGYPYRYGGETPETGFDCSGFVQYVFEQHGIFIPRTAREMADQLSEPESVHPSPGDLVFFNTSGVPFSHVGIYLGKDRFIHASNHRKGVKVSKMKTSYWSSRYLGARRAIPRTPEDSDIPDSEPEAWFP